jgi:hypothetical protein
MNLTGNVSVRMMVGAKDIDAILTAGWAILASDLLDIPAAVVAIVLVRAISGRQERARDLVALRESAAVFAD